MSLTALVGRELKSRSRKASTLVFRVIYLGFLACVSLALVTTSPDAPGAGAGIARTVFYSEWVALGLAALILPSIALGQERRTRALEYLRVAGVHPAKIVLGKIAGALALLILLQLSALPIQFIALAFGGLSVEKIVLANVLLLLMMLVHSGFSAVGGAAGRGLLAVLLAAVYYLGPRIAVAVAGESGMAGAPELYLYTGWTPLLCSWVRPAPYVWAGAGSYAAGVVGAVVTFSLSVWLASSLLERASAVPEGEGKLARLRRRLMHGLVRLLPVERLLLRQLIWKSPFVWRETRRTAGSRPAIGALLFLLGLGAWTLCFAGYQRRYVDWLGVMQAALYFIVGLLPGLSFIGSVFEDRDKRAFTCLLAAPPGAGSLVRAKFIHSILSNWPFIALLLLLAVTPRSRGAGVPGAILLVILAPGLAFWSASLGALAATGMKSRTRSTILYVALLWLWATVLPMIGMPFLVVLVGYGSGSYPYLDALSVLLLFSLFAAFVVAVLSLIRLERKIRESA